MLDKELRRDIIDELDFEPSIDAAYIGVAVDEGVVVLTGHVPTLSEKRTAMDIVESIKGVRVIVDKIEVRPVGENVTADDEIAKRILNTLQWNTAIPADRIRAKVSNGHVTLVGDVDWRYQAEVAENAVARLGGVTGITNHIEVNPAVHAEDVINLVKKALLRDAELDASGIQVEVQDGTVTLEGKVRYLGERRSAEKAAWSAPGVITVVDHLSVE